MTVTADLVRSLIVDHDRSRPRSRQTAVGPSNLSSPCARKVAYQLLDVPPVAEQPVSLAAWVGTGIHAQMETALADSPDWETEVPVTVQLSKSLKVSGTLDAYHRPSCTVVDWKSVGPAALTKYRAASPDRYLTQVAVYGLGAVLTGRMTVNHTAIVYIPRNGDLSDIHVDCHPWDDLRADKALKRYEQLHTAAAAGPAILPLLPTGDDCRYCPWWRPGTPEGQADACPGHPPQNPHAAPAPWEPQEKEEASA